MNPSPSIQSFVPLSRLFQAPAASAGFQDSTVKPFSPAVLGEHADRPGIELHEIRQFRVAGKEYVFVPAVSAIFGLDDLGRQILDLLRPPDYQLAVATEAVQTAATRHAPLPEIIGALEPNFSRSAIVAAVKELRDIGV